MTVQPSPYILMLAAMLVSSLVLMTSATGQEIYESRGVKSGSGGDEKKPLSLNYIDKRPFFVGSRYGRSQSDLTNMDENGKPTNLQRIVPRNDRFFLGSRYGKRSSPITALDENQNEIMNCFYTGVANIFRCNEKIDLQFNTEAAK